MPPIASTRTSISFGVQDQSSTQSRESSSYSVISNMLRLEIVRSYESCLTIQVDDISRQLLEKITGVRETCQTFSASPQRFRLSILQSDIVFNQKVALELMTIEKNSAPYVVHIENHMNSAIFLLYETPESI